MCCAEYTRTFSAPAVLRWEHVVSRLCVHILFPSSPSRASPDRCPRLIPSAMFLYRCHVLAVLTGCFLVRCVYVKCKQDTCGDDHMCCFQQNNSTGLTCCTGFDKTYHNIAMITRKLSGVLIMLLLFAVGYFVQRMLCSRSRQSAPSHDGQSDVTASRELLVETCSPSSSMTPVPAVQLPSYDACKRLPTYEETMRELGSRGRPESPTGQAT